jgi:hypothetical protein
VAIANRAGFTDINVVSESVMQNLFNTLETGAAYVNRNIDEPNADSIDLADQHRRIALQITSTTKPAKIRKTIAGFEKNDLKQEFSTLKFLFLDDSYRPKTTYSTDGVTILFENLGDLATRVDRVEDSDQLQKVVDLLERELGLAVQQGKALLKIASESVKVTPEMIRAECRVTNLGEFTAENVQIEIRPAATGRLRLIPAAEWFAISGGADPSTRIFQAASVIHPKRSIRAIIELDTEQASLGTTFVVGLASTNTPTHYDEIDATPA